VISVRGTLFVAGVYAGGEAIITVLDGSVYVNEVLLEAGYTMRVYDGLEMIYERIPLHLEDLDDFALQAVLEHQERLSDIIDLDETPQDESFAPNELLLPTWGFYRLLLRSMG